MVKVQTDSQGKVYTTSDGKALISSSESSVVCVPCACVSSDAVQKQNVQYTLSGEGDIIDSGECTVYVVGAVSGYILCIAVPFNPNDIQSYSMFIFQCSITTMGGQKTFTAIWNVDSGQLDDPQCYIS